MNRKNKTSAVKAAFVGVLASVAVVFGYVEYLIPFDFGVPGFKLGLANIVTLLLLNITNAYIALGVLVVRIVLTGLLFGASTIPYSLAGGLLAFVCMFLLGKSKKFSLIGVSVSGGVAHNIGQIAVGMIVTDNFRLAYYLPILLVSGCVTGAMIGVVSKLMIPKLGFVKKEFSKTKGKEKN